MINVKKSLQELIIENEQLLFEVNNLKSIIALYLGDERTFQLSDSIADLLPVAVFNMDIQGTIIYCNQYAYILTGYNEEDFSKGFKALELLAPEEWERGRKNIYQVMQGNTLGDVEYTARRKNGQKMTVIIRSSPIYENGKVIGLRGIIFDVTERKKLEDELILSQDFLKKLVDKRTSELQRALATLQQEIAERHYVEKALRLSEEMFFKAFDHSPNIMIISTIDAKRILKVNKSFVRITGYSIQDAIVPILLNIISQEQLEIIRKMLRYHGEIKNLETNFRIKTGEIRVGLLSIDIIELNGQSHLLLIMNDITDKINFEKELARLDRLNLIGEMAAGIGHEIRNPLTTVRGFLQLFKGKDECLHQQEYLDLMIEELDRANSIISEFLSLAKNKSISKNLTNLNKIIKTIAPLMQADAVNVGKSIQLELSTIPDLLVDEKEIRQIILNLARNGLEAMSQGGLLTITTFMQKEEIVLSIKDQGSGINPEIIDKLGTPFFTTKDNGTGLGLAICYSIASRHGATIKIDPTNSGTIFSVHFSA